LSKQIVDWHVIFTSRCKNIQKEEPSSIHNSTETRFYYYYYIFLSSTPTRNVSI